MAVAKSLLKSVCAFSPSIIRSARLSSLALFTIAAIFVYMTAKSKNGFSEGTFMKTVVHRMKAEESGAAIGTLGFEPKMDLVLAAQIKLEKQPFSPEETQKLLNNHSLIVRSEGSLNIADILLTDGTFFSPRLKALVDELEPGVHEYYKINVVSEMPLGGKTDHGVYYFVRSPPLIDCIIFPETKTIADIQGKVWSKTDPGSFWGGGPATSTPGYVDRKCVANHHFWRTKTGNHPQSWFYTWSDELYRKFKKAGMHGWVPAQSFEAVDIS